jgi:hypothetical protein
MQSNISDQQGKNTTNHVFFIIIVNYRSLWPDDFGDEHNEIDVALTILYESLKKTHTAASMFDDK